MRISDRKSYQARARFKTWIPKWSPQLNVPAVSAVDYGFNREWSNWDAARAIRASIQTAGSGVSLGGTLKSAHKCVCVCDINGWLEQPHNSGIREKPVVITTLSLVPDQNVPLQINEGRLWASTDGSRSVFFCPESSGNGTASQKAFLTHLFLCHCF